MRVSINILDSALSCCKISFRLFLILWLLWTHMRPAKAIGEDYGRIYAFVNHLDFPRTAHNYQCIRWMYIS